MWELFAREVPYEGLDPTDIMQKVVNGEGLPEKKTIPVAI